MVSKQLLVVYVTWGLSYLVESFTLKPGIPLGSLPSCGKSDLQKRVNVGLHVLQIRLLLILIYVFCEYDSIA